MANPLKQSLHAFKKAKQASPYSFEGYVKGYILPEKFGFDKQKAHLSALLASGKMTREEAGRIKRNDLRCKNAC